MPFWKILLKYIAVVLLVCIATIVGTMVLFTFVNFVLNGGYIVPE